MSDSELQVNNTTSEVAAPMDYGQFGNTGFENQTVDDLQIPFIAIAQDMSPELKQSKAEYIEGCNAGDLFNTVTREVLPKEVYFLPCHTERKYVEWKDRETTAGGLVGIFDPTDERVVETIENSPDPLRLTTDDGNNLVETFYVSGLVLDSPHALESSYPAIISFSVTKVKVYKKFMSAIYMQKGNAPLFAHMTKITVVEETNQNNKTYYNYSLKPAFGSIRESMIDPNGDQAGLLNEGFELNKSVSSGAVKANMESIVTAEADDEDEQFA